MSETPGGGGSLIATGDSAGRRRRGDNGTVRVPSSDHVNLAVHEFGGDGPPLLLSHATGFHGYAYLPIADALDRRFTSYALDYRGHGDTPRAGEDAPRPTPTGRDTAMTRSPRLASSLPRAGSLRSATRWAGRRC